MNDFFRDKKALLPHSYACTADQLGTEYALPLQTCKAIQFISCNEQRWKPWQLLPPDDQEAICHRPPDGLFYWALRAWQRVYQQTPVRTSLADVALVAKGVPVPGTGSSLPPPGGGGGAAAKPVVGYVWQGK